MQTEPLVNQYLGECESRGLSPKTLEQRRWALQRLITSCPDWPTGDAELLPVLSDTDLAIESRRDLEKCLRTFFRWATKRYKVNNPTPVKVPESVSCNDTAWHGPGGAVSSLTIGWSA